MRESDDPRLRQFYQDVPKEQLARLKSFRSAHPYQMMEIDGEDWRYIDTQHGEPVILILPGATTIAEISFNTLEYLAQEHRVIAPDYPPIVTIAALFDGYLEMLDRLAIERFVLMGGSYGGWMAQSMLRHVPDRIDKVILSAIGPPNPENSRQLAKMLWLLRLLPFGLLRALMNRSFANLVSDGELEPVQTLMMAQLSEIMHTRVERKDILAALRRLIDQTDNYTFAADDLKGWPGRMLILMGSEDPSTTADKREAMAQLYPLADHIVFEGADHSLSIPHKEAYYSAINDFLSH